MIVIKKDNQNQKIIKRSFLNEKVKFNQFREG